MGIATLWMAIVADMGASLLVIFNAIRLLKGGRRPEEEDHLARKRDVALSMGLKS